MQGFVRFVLKNKFAVWLLTLIVTFAGIYSTTQMKMESIPDISIPYLIVSGVYPGAAPEQVMEEVSIPVEQAVESLEDVKAVYSNSSSNVSQIQIEYDYGVDMDEKKRELESAVDGVNLPEEVETPSIMSIGLNMFPVVALSVSSDTESIVELTDRVQTTILPEIEKIDGVASATVTGQHVEEIHLTYDEAAMAAREVTEEDIQQMIEASNIALSLGLREFEEGEEAVYIDGSVASIEEFEELLIPVTPSEDNPEPFVALSELADVELVGKVQSISRTNGEDAIAIQIVKGQEANTVTVVNEVKDLMADLESEVDGLIVDITLDQGEPIEESVFAMVEKALFGGLIAVLIILVFLRDLRSTLIAIVSIPVSIFVALLLLNRLDITLNIMTLGAITVSIGRVIDDSIVVVENIYRRMHLKEEKLSGRKLIQSATIEMFKPILSSTLVTIAVFAPLVFVGGMVGELFLPFALTMSFALLASLAVAVSIVPAMSHSFFKKKLYGKKTASKHQEVGKMALWFRSFLEKSLNHKWITSIIAVVLLAGSLALTPLIGFSFLGSQTEKMMYITYSPSAGELQEETVENIEAVEQDLLEREDIDVLQLSINDSANADMAQMMMGGGDGALLYLIFDDSISVDEFEEARSQVTDYLAGLDQSGEWGEQDMMGGGMAASSEVAYTLYSEDLDDLMDTVAQVEGAMSEVDGLEEVTSDAEDPYVEHTLRIEQQEILQYGLTAGQVAMALSGGGQNEVLTTVNTDGGELEVIVQRDAQQDAATFEELLETPVPTAAGTMMTVGELVEVEEGTTLNTLSRSEGAYYATVSGTVTGNDVSAPSAAVQENVDQLDLPTGVTVETGGVTADINETFTQLGLAMAAAIAIVYFILVVTFGGGLAPFAILFSLPFAVIGAFVGLYVTGQTISVSVMMGLLMLIGIVVTNAIVLVDRVIHMEREGMTVRNALLEAGTTRLRPILMTAIATIGAMIPMALSSGGGGLVSQDLAITVIGGLLSSTLLTLVVVPVVYEILRKFQKNKSLVDRED
ncbi:MULTISPECIES: efflux RND transporter permease subunit [unclassified Planococcus (in: firmicutes)]|uniref:efflux RND transporter permease subunit n=1 Tax=unclassified Planococcus (in: firmicutes) TaxID=2662419 RepID=UPI000C33FF5B|nr:MULTISPECIES: efflux RND transporter permease subunit [unclassified Planococcus (in: firmicutes)]AUD15163.1 Swarming motility protein SwrC [Planococcus sp. MB-3u-03]PKG46295.1 Swarming motility protein SwrC [Planococcus sp. Urea-trap-24]PKG90081.1 Swarming motility protein SwrC [Planococcus sp. Urea-3u-39]PKH35793.1 Swarming motility protein SwrC [Planococcus sp. MB-3u-09]